MKKTLWLVVAVVVVALAVYFVFNKPQPASGESIKIGAAMGLTGDAAAWGEPSLNAAKLAVEEINKNGGINGRPLELVVEDTKSTSKDTISAVQKLQNIDGAHVFLVTWLDVYQGAENLLKPGDLMFSADAGAEAVNGTTLHPNVFVTWYRTGPKTDLTIKHMSEHGKKTLYILVQNDSYYTSVTEFLIKAAKKYNVEVLGVEKVNPGADLKTILTKIGTKKPSAVFFGSYDDALNIEFLKRKNSLLGQQVAVYGDELAQQNYQRPEFAGLYEGVYFHAPKTPDTRFVADYKVRYGSEPIFSAGPTYDAVNIIAQTLKAAPEDYSTYMRSTTFDTASYGQATFDAVGGILTKENYFVMDQVQDGKAVEVQ